MSQLLGVSVGLVLLIFTLGLFAYRSPSRIPVFPGSTHVEVSIPNAPTGPISIQEVLRLLYAPLKLSPTEASFTDEDGTVYNLPEKPMYETLLKKDILILDLETRPLDKKNQLMNEGKFNWKTLDGLSGGVLNHYTYAMIHGYDYKFIHAAPFTDRHDTWIKPSAIANVLKNYRFVIFLDADAAFHQMHIPIEWLLNYWEITPETSIAMALDPAGPPGINDDRFNRTLSNTGFIISQRSDRTQEILRAWHECPDDTRYANCSQWSKPRFHEQSAFGNYIRYDYEENLKEIPCTEANGYPGTLCEGVFIRHYWYGKQRVRNDFANSTMQAITAPLQRMYLDQREQIVQEQVVNEII
ncbi:hypothetical protein K432DRAFT_312588 [Lepidopterella palustris CBS 459.81]|uniref:Nucleotide-diphospho-sugar transferase domain-containing protein n=1 Tax=Lepidopterella palustris CBS 459.81 TaxID=1314670 RepID=A0A8E2J9A8_9PEZI|nr:hypothetical protein K432DRAFT_312588 [Lepidopterella palustris CBS 459.81]